MPRYGRVVLGGTFDRLHVGHEALLATAFHLGRTVAIGLTTPAFLRAHPKPSGGQIQAYGARQRALARWIRRHFAGRPFQIVPLDNPFGRSVEAGVDLLVVSAETAGGGAAVNRERRRRGLPSVPVAIVPLVLADDLLPVSSRRIRVREVDRRGRRISPIRVELRLSGEAPWAARAVRAVFPRAQVLETRDRRTGGRRPPVRRGLRLDIRPRADGGWTVVESGPTFSLAARRLAPGPSSRLERSLRELLRPALGRPCATI